MPLNVREKHGRSPGRINQTAPDAGERSGAAWSRETRAGRERRPPNRYLSRAANPSCEGSNGRAFGVVCRYHDTMAKNFTVRLPDDVAADAEALARAEGKSLNETVKSALIEAVERRRNDPEFKKTLKRIIEQDRELLERLAK